MSKENKEIEVRFINLSRDDIEKKLLRIGAERTGEFFFREWIFAQPEWEKDHRRLRVRTDGRTTWLTYKANPTWEVDSTEERETTVGSAEEISNIIKAIGVPCVRYQEKKRIRYVLNDIVFELDFWPQIPMVFEIEASSVEKVKEGARLLGLDYGDAIFVDQKVLHKEYYGIDLDSVQSYKFAPQ